MIGSIYASIYASRLTEALPAHLPGSIADSAERSVGTAFGAAASSMPAGSPAWPRALHDAASAAFFDGYQTAILVAAGIALAGAIMAAILIPNQPPRDCIDELELPGGELGSEGLRELPELSS